MTLDRGSPAPSRGGSERSETGQWSGAGTPARYPTLDLLRVLAVSMTVLLHAPSVAAKLPIISSVPLGLNLGVDLFMLISGWLLGGQLIREQRAGQLSARRFYLKRWLRTLPPFYAVLIALACAGALADTDSAAIASHFVFLQEYLEVQRYGVSWSLCVEEHFYLLLPLLVPALVQQGCGGPSCEGSGCAEHGCGRRMLLAAASVSALEVLGRTLVYQPGEHLPYLSHLRSEGLFLGLALACVAECDRAGWARLGRWCHALLLVGVPATGLAMLLSHTAPSLLFYTALPTLGTWALALAFVACVHERSPLSRLSLPGARYLGDLTYSIYLVHTLVPPLLRHDALASFEGSNAAAAALMLALSALLHHAVERPCLRLRQRLLLARAKAPLELPPLAPARPERLDQTRS